MLAHFSNRETWTVLNLKLEEALGMDAPRSSLKLYQGLHHALMEVVMGLAKQFPFKKDIYYWKGIDPFLEPVAMALAREGYKVTPLNLEQITNPDSWMNTLPKDTLMVILPEDDPLLGKLHPIQAVTEKLKDQKIFSVKLAHHAFHYRPWPTTLNKFQVEIYAINSHLTLAFLGERARFGDWMSEGLIWKGDEVEVIKKLRPEKTIDANKITAFEKSLAPDFTPLFKTEDRLLDRAVFYREDMDGLALIESLAELLKTELLPPGEETRFETPSLSRWGGLRTMDWLKAFSLTPNQIRGLVILSSDLINPDLRSLLSKAKDEVLKRQGS